ncbi:gamma-glutamyl-gamma-aminobutyrate hydrolase family protein [Levilactobacillus namurensis]|uniref:gamma-glutamyl-gamma-aminobutyrate hydrolase family protein n=1 Tax=Levilactobacillus namurensis TaxID=380393 RepID=UPI001D81D62A|nr:type 1 glutamine amidotransferase [Levilactobacillus namurensis]HJE46047.1 type 1 glutamine amidotransferase [Levilactobacillus namurensis]
MKKIIGITADELLAPMPYINQQHADFVPRPLVDAVTATQAIPLGLSPVPTTDVADLLAPLDGLILTGGPDVDPTFMGEDPRPALGITNRRRDIFEIALVRAAVAQHLPILAICRGMHVVNVALGGTLYQDLLTQYPGKDLLKHQQAAPGNLPTHTVTVRPSALQDAVGQHPFVNSRHHQAVRFPADDVLIVARASDGVIEGIENADASIQGVQWHPENMWREFPEQRALFQAFTDRL